MRRVMCVSLPIEVVEWIEREASRRNVTKSYVVEEAVRRAMVESDE